MDHLRGLCLLHLPTSATKRWVVSLVLVASVICMVKGDRDVLLDYCEDATFGAKCPDNHVIMMVEARYGRMSTGQCLSVNYGSMGCSSDVLQVMDRYCSGRRSCKVNVRDLVVEGARPCPKDLRSYLEAQYTCMPVLAGKSDCCATTSQARLRKPSGQIASIVTEETGCGSIDCPWLIQVPQGQRVNISLFEFALPSLEEMRTVREKMPPFSKVCHVYAIIKEKAVGSALTLCAGEQRHRHLFMSTTNEVEIRIFTKKKMERESYFVLKYQAVGCADPQTPLDGWVKRLGDKVNVGCGDPEKVWQLVCHGNRWLGEAGNCSGAVRGFNVGGVLDNILSLSPDLSIVVIVLVAMVIAFVILIVGVFCLKRKWTTSRRSRGGPGGVNSPSHRVDLGDVNKNSTLHNAALNGGGGSGHNYFRTWELQRHNNNGSNGRQHGNHSIPETGTIASETLQRQLGGMTSGDDGQYDVRYVEHVYESPTFHRKDISESDDPAQYYELDPEAEIFTPRIMGGGGGVSGSGGIGGMMGGGSGVSGGMPPPVPTSERSAVGQLQSGSNQRCSYPGTNAHHQNHMNTAGNYTS